MTRRVYLSQQSGTGAAPYKVVRSDAMGAEAFVPEADLANTRREAMLYAARAEAPFSREAADAIRALVGRDG
jgi:hypothetical protein